MKKFFSDRKLLLIAAITLAVTLPFANKAFHIDDPTVLDTASHILSTPAKPYNFDYNWMGARVPMSEVRMHPPLQEYFAAFLILITGGTNEIIFHIIFAVFPLILAYSCYFLTKRFSSCPLFATLLIMLSPAVMVNSHNVMNDIPSLALFTAGVAIYVYGADNKNKTALLISALPIFCAMGITYQAFAIIPLLFIYSCLKKRMSFITILPLLIASGLILLFLTFVSISSDNSLFSGIIKNFGKTGGFHIF